MLVPDLAPRKWRLPSELVVLLSGMQVVPSKDKPHTEAVRLFEVPWLVALLVAFFQRRGCQATLQASSVVALKSVVSQAQPFPAVPEVGWPV
jgi:hypothetical protein